MVKKLDIIDIQACEILDSRGNPTVECKLVLADGSPGYAKIPSGASTGSFEACEKRDGDKSRYWGKGVKKVVDIIENRIFPELKSNSFSSYIDFDNFLCDLDGTDNKSNLGANSILAVSQAYVCALANSRKIDLYRFFKDDNYVLPIPQMNIINGGAHADNDILMQEFMLVPHGFSSFSEALRAGVEIGKVVGDSFKGQLVGRGDEGGYAPNMKDATKVLDLLSLSIEKAGYNTDKVAIALDVASSEFYKEGNYYLDKKFIKKVDASLWIDYLESLVKDYAIVSLEDPMAEEDFAGWKEITEKLGKDVQIVGDDVFVSCKDRLEQGVEGKMANAVLIKPNQVGSISEVIKTLQYAKTAGYNRIISHRSGETESGFIADFAVGMGCEQIKAGPAKQSDRIAKYNRLLWIEKELGVGASFANIDFRKLALHME